MSLDGKMVCPSPHNWRNGLKKNGADITSHAAFLLTLVRAGPIIAM